MDNKTTRSCRLQQRFVSAQHRLLQLSPWTRDKQDEVAYLFSTAILFSSDGLTLGGAMKHLLTGIALAFTSLAAGAQLSFSGGTNLTSFAGYNPNGSTSPQTQGVEDALINAGAGGFLTATFLGFEALDTDNFAFVLGAGMLTNQTSALGATISGPVAGGNLNFTFVDTTFSQSVGNGGNASVYASYAVLGTFSGSTFTPYHGPSGQYDLVLGFNDGMRVDADYDDLVVGLNLAPVPEPETYALFAAGLAAVGFVARRRRSSVA